MNGSERALPGALRARLAALPESARAAALLAHVRTRGAWFLQLAEVDAVGPDAPWSTLGLDSLRAVDFRGELAHDLDLELRSTLLFDQPTPQALVAHLLERLGPSAPAAPSPAAQPPGANEPIAIVGAACRFPGGESLDEFRRLLEEGRDAVGPIPRERFDVDEFYDPDPNADGKLYVREAALLGHIDRFDAGCFGISPREAVMLDPQQRLLLETSLHALEHANLPPASLPGDRVGVYIGIRASAYFDSQSGRTAEEATAYQATGNEISTSAGRIAYTFGFQGPCYALDTACSGSLVALHVAVRALRARECDVALAGGVNTIYDPVTMSGLCRARMLSPDGRCRTFDASANGYGRGEGCGIVVLKRLTDAVAAGDRVLAVVRGTAINQDGRSGGLTVPHGPSQTAVIRAALADAGVGVDAIDYVEAHGTGTALGDPIEVGALDAAFAGRTRPLPIGSVKTNIGHLESAAGISGLLKVVLALQARTLPKNLHFHAGNPHIDWARSVTRVVAEPLPLPRDRELFAGISSFGFSGTNAHVVLASAPAALPACAPCAPPVAARGPFLLGLQAATTDALRALALAHADALEHSRTDLGAWCHAAAVGRAANSQRAAFVAHERAELVTALRTFGAGNDAGATAVGQAAAPAPPIAFLFPGQGAQRAGMGRELYEQEPAFRDALDAANERLAGMLPAALPELLFGAHTDLLDRTDVTQPALCAYELALLATFRAVGVVPEQVLGHSIGDFPAAVAAGVMDGGDALRLCAARGRLMVERCVPGGLLVVLAPLERWQALLGKHAGATIAVRNGTANFAVGGDRTVLQALQRDLEAAHVPTRLLPVSHSFHTAHTEPMLEPFAALVAGTRLRPPERTFLDCKRGTFGGPEVATAAHWRAQVREPVDFLAGLQLLAQGPCRVWFELGPSPMLTVLARDVARRSVRVLPAQRPGLAGRAGLLTALAEAWVHGTAVDLAAANHCRGPVHAVLPGYPFQRERFWLDRAPTSAAMPVAHPAATHALLGERVESSLLAEGQILHQARIGLGSQPWLADHVVFDRVLLPAAAMFEAALAAEVEAGSTVPVALHHVVLRAPRPLAPTPTTLELLRTEQTDGTARVALRGRDDDGTFRAHLDGSSGPWSGEPPADLDPASLRERGNVSLPPEQLYARAASLHLDYGPAFQGIHEVHVGPSGVLARVRLAADLAREARAFVLHPALLDACFQACLLLVPDDRRTWLPIGVEELVVFRRSVSHGVCHLRVRTQTTNSLTCDLDLGADDGSPTVSVRGLQLVPADADALAAHTLRDHLHHVVWDTAPAPGPAPLPGHVVLLGDHGLAEVLARTLPAGTTLPSTIEELPQALARQRPDLVLVLATDAAAPAATTFTTALAVVHALARLDAPPRLGFVTHGTSDAGPAPAGAAPTTAVLHGFVRTLALEHPALRPFLLDLDPLVPANAVAEHAATLAAELRTTLAEPEVAFRAGTRRVRRLQRGLAPADRMAVPAGPFRVRTRAYGSFDNLGCLPLVRRTPGPDEIEVELHATALNFKDVLHARGLLRTFAVQFGVESPEQQPLGLEGTGVVVACGANVRGIAIGDTVVVQAYDCLASHVTVAAGHAFVVPPGIDPNAAAGTAVTGSTVLHGLFDLAQVRAGETVLVHAAAGGVGQAAIALLRATGCRVLATASASKRACVQGLGAEVVGDTRGGDFRAAVQTATNGRGVDVVLNTLAGEFVPRSLDVLARGGRFVELGKLGVWTADQVAAVRPDVRFFAFELGEAAQRDPNLLPGLYARVHQALANGTLKPPTATVLPLARLREAFDHLARGHHVGKVCVLFPKQGDAVRPDRSWLVTGGSGGVARAVAVALVEAGARHLVLLARGEVPPTLQDELRARGATVLAVRADVADRAGLAAALRTARATMPPFQGVVHTAGALGDAMLTSLSPATVPAVLAPKVTGALLLDELLADEPLDHFVLTSSMAGTFGNAGQAAYAAANTFLDAFAAWRRARGLPATSIAFGPWAEAGMAARLDDRLRARLQQAGIGLLPPAATARLLVQQRAAVHDFAVLPIRWPDWLATLRPPPQRFFAAVATKSPAVAAPPDAQLDLRALPRDERRPALHRAVQAQIAKVLGFANGDQLGGGRAFRDFGLDSLLAVDAKDRLERLTGLVLPATLLFDQPDLERLVGHLLAALPSG